jgi:hypothetical protein
MPPPGGPAGGGQMIESPDWWLPGGGGGTPLTPGQPQQRPAGTATQYGNQYGPGGLPPIGPGLIDPNVANNPYANRPPPFQATSQNFDGTQSQMPNFQQRDAFINQINNQLGQMQGQSWQKPGMGPPQFNFPQMWGQAGEMAGKGFKNPFAMQGGGALGQLMAGDITPAAMRNPGLLPPLPPGAVY